MGWKAGECGRGRPWHGLSFPRRRRERQRRDSQPGHKGEYSLDCRANPWQLGLVLPVPEEMAAEAGPQVPAELCFVLLAGAGDVIHFCQALVSPDRPQAFEGPGYCILRPAVPMPQEEEKQKKTRAQRSSSASTGIPAATKSPRSAGSSTDDGGAGTAEWTSEAATVGGGRCRYLDCC